MASRELTVRYTSPTDPAARPLLDELTHEYRSRYGPNEEMSRYPATEFAPPHGAFLLLLQPDGSAVAGGAFRRYDRETAEIKRVWTHSGHRRQGLARRVMRELEAEAVRRGYRRIWLTTGPRQPEAEALYLNLGYHPRYDLDADRAVLPYLPFETQLPYSTWAPFGSEGRP
ncbi:GNAT family N-acetyltransferase [Micromonospora sp. NBC_01796]|uniref:GNAT family N-acetyltransferase n=1 Tax=Micromonospora sp. NBC_01796 TaxID=2975987 RepID=UPI002DDA5F2B|nr:GNAT family N-acetyltransferase [Micromonospora sp. NBC_01796]WSA84812.1 GNAT family N-acetyltransferase [Micromonospora sp. NBC_01796]